MHDLPPRAALTALLLLAAASAQDPAGPRVAVGDLPDAREADPTPAVRTTIDVTPAGALAVAGATVEPRQLVAALAAAAADAPTRDVTFDGRALTLSERDVVVRAAEGVPAFVVAALRDACAEARTPRVWLAVRRADEEQAFPIFLPDPGTARDRLVRVTIRGGTPQSSTGAVYRALRDAVAEGVTACAEVAARIDVADLVDTFDIARRAGHRRLTVRAVPGVPKWSALTAGGLAAAFREPTVDEVDRVVADVIATGDRDDPLARVATAAAAATAATAAEDEPEFEAPPGEAINTAVGLGGSRPPVFGARGGFRVYASLIDPGLAWLAAAQGDDGSFADGDVTTTALAMIAFLGDGNSPRSGTHRDAVKLGIGWLHDRQAEDGSFAGADDLRTHALATHALVEAQGLSGWMLLRAPAQRAVDHLVAQRSADGGWTVPDDDAHTLTWCLAACMAASAFGLEIDAELAPTAARRLVDRARAPDAPPNLGATALFGAFLSGDADLARTAKDALVPVLVAEGPATAARRIEWWIDGSHALFQAGGTAWRDWQDALTPTVRRARVQTGDAAGSWDPVEGSRVAGDRLRATAAMVIVLEASSRYGRLVR